MCVYIYIYIYDTHICLSIYLISLSLYIYIYIYTQALFEHSSDWYSEAQPVEGKELPFLYVRTISSTAPDDALEPYPAESLLAVDNLGNCRLDLDLLSLSRALRRRRFPELQDGLPGAALAGVRGHLRAAVMRDLEVMRSDADGARRLAPGYWQELGGDLGLPQLATWGEAGEAPEGSALATTVPPLRPPPQESAARKEAEPQSLPTPDEALRLIEAALSEI